MTKLSCYQKVYRIVRVLAERGQCATYVIRNILDWPEVGRDGSWRGVKTPQVLATCKIAQRIGLIEEVPSSYLVMKSWRITDAGRALVVETHLTNLCFDKNNCTIAP